VQDGARLRLHRLLTAIHGIVGHHPASRGAAADTSQPAHVQEEHAAAAELHRAVQRVLSEAQSAAAPAGGPATAEADGGGGTAEAANGSGVHDAGLGFVSEDEDEEVCNCLRLVYRLFWPCMRPVLYLFLACCMQVDLTLSLLDATEYVGKVWLF
jgi:hypothetical protein